jgi:uncharacterized C2H2 Zn-finger protein
METMPSFRCQACGAAFATREQLEQHNRQAHPGMQAQSGQSFHCDTCGATFATRAELEAHARYQHMR